MIWVYTPKKTRNLAHFAATDPWNDNKQTRFDLDQCFSGGFTPGHAAFDDESKPHRFAIKSQLEREHRVLPDSLAALWKSGKISAEQLPALLKGLEPDLKRSDYIRLLTMNPRQRSIRTWGARHFMARSCLPWAVLYCPTTVAQGP